VGPRQKRFMKEIGHTIEWLLEELASNTSRETHED
jgi:hypothetical protein